jgi:hypothetical protein
MLASFIGSEVFHKRLVPTRPENERSDITVGRVPMITGELDRAPLQVWQRVDAFFAAAPQDESFHRSKSAPLNGIRN